MHSSFLHLYQQEVEHIVQSLPPELAYTQAYLSQGGKMQRPTFYLEACDAIGTTPNMRVAIAIELLHMFFLIHDDVMDDDDVRRNVPTLHKAFESFQSPHGAKALAIVVGDIVFNHAMGIFAQELPPQDVAVVQDIIHDTARGQIEEFVRATLPTLDMILGFYRRKTAYYTMYLPLYLACSQDPYVDLAHLRTLSEHLGMLFQLHDDILELQGKKIRGIDAKSKSDLLHLKPTPPLLLVLPHLPTSLHQRLMDAYQHHAMLSADDMDAVYACMIENHIFTACFDHLEASMQFVRDALHHPFYQKIPSLMKYMDTYSRPPL